MELELILGNRSLNPGVIPYCGLEGNKRTIFCQSVTSLLRLRPPEKLLPYGVNLRYLQYPKAGPCAIFRVS